MSVWVAATSRGEDDDIPLLDFALMFIGMSTIICAVIGAAASLAGSKIEPLRLRLLTVVLAASLAGMAVNWLLGLGYDFFASPETCVPLIGGTIGSALGVIVDK